MEGSIPSYPLLIEDLELIPAQDGTVQVRGPGTPLILRGEATRQFLPRLLPLLDGSRSVDDILGAMPDVDQSRVLSALKLLYSKGLLEDAGAAGTEGLSPEELRRHRAQLNFFSRYIGVSRKVQNRYEAQRRLKDAHVLLTGRGLILRELGGSLAEAGIGDLRVEERPAPSREELAGLIDPELDLVLLAVPRPTPGVASWVNELAVATGVRWLPVVMDGRAGSVGPTVVPMESACYHCYRGRRLACSDFPREDQDYETYLDSHDGKLPSGSPDGSQVSDGPTGEWAPFTRLVASVAAIEVVRLLTGLVAPATINRVLLMDALTGESREARVVKLPRCPVCSPAATTPERC